ncbi:hypothetical protein SAMN05660923_02352 [Tepidimicrobium xylanilyticum]|uniref:Uncharacterized protein n=1 Tax=Tepidimicrobium xylanilyticum TaxID=1123352 RepID=A0A1H3BYX7_9FIRM|nr:hypothetical protein SAMN05660923_02352 [Tepidimicrobium xylanilyticum]
MTIKHITSVVVFYFIFDLIFFILSKRNSKILLPFRKIPKKWRGKYFYKWLVLFPLLVICSIIIVFFQLNYISFGLLIGFTLSLCDTAFKENVS